MNVRRLALGCLLPSFPGHDVPDWVLRRLDEGLAGITLFAYNIGDRGQLARLTARLRDAGAGLIAVDEEGGDVTRLEAERGSSYPGNLALGVIDDVELTAEVGAAIASDLAAVGINLNFAPVADVNVDPDNPVIGVRSFGADPELVARHVAAFVEGTQRHGVAACAKHFPGHGDTSVDSHLELPVVSGGLDAGLPPFRSAVAAGARAIMTAHLVVPEVDVVPATLSRTILTDVLRRELGFRGLVVSDALEMRAISAGVGVDAAAVASLAAGADALCVGHDLHEEAVDSIANAIAAGVADGQLPLERLEEAAARVEETARWASSPSVGAANGGVGAEAARRAVRVVGSPLVAAPPFVVELVPEANVAAGRHEHGLGALWPGATGVRLAQASARVEPPADRPLVVVARDLCRHAWQRELVASWPHAVVVETGVPGAPGVDVVTHGAGRANLEAAVEALRVPSSE